tara:strand:+ start:7452 stop:7673 length:222 start_codon:yes stop_codon:yes gene_type:complete
MSVFQAMASVESYLANCPNEKTRQEAKKDFSEALKEIIKIGYTWGRTHQIPIEHSGLQKEDLVKILNFINKNR